MIPIHEQSQPHKRALSMGEFWSQRVSEASNLGLDVSLTVKQRGQLKMLANKVGRETEELISFAVDNWAKFGYQAQLDEGLPCYPREPHIGFLLAHYPSARRLSAAAHREQALSTERSKLGVLEAKERAQANDEAARRLVDQNEKDIKEMRARFEAAGEACPPVSHNDRREVVYQATEKERAALLARF